MTLIPGWYRPVQQFQGGFTFTKSNCIIARPAGTNYNTHMASLKLDPHLSSGAQITPLGENSWRLSCPGGPAGQYRLSQLDDYHQSRRSGFPWSAPCRLTLEARASANHLLGTWGFGFWNDPFGLSIGFGGTRLLPSWPDAAWFFFASEHNHLSFRDHLPAAGALAAVFRPPAIPLWVLAPGAVAAPLLFWRWFSRLARRLAAKLVQEESVLLGPDMTDWHRFELVWEADGLQFLLDGKIVQETHLTPRGPLGLVLWLDNQYAAWHPDGSLKYGTLETGPRWVEIRKLAVE